MPQIQITDTRGLEQKTGTGVQIDSITNTSQGLTVLKEGVSEIGHTGLVIGKSQSTHATANPYEESATQLWPLGTKLLYGDREFAYARMGGAVTAGKLVAQAVHQGADHLDMEITSGDVPAVGSFRISLETNGTDLTANQYAGGYIYVNDGTGEGQLMKIKSHAAHTHGSDPTVIFTTFDPVTVALVAGGTSMVTIHQNKYYKVVIAAHAEASALAGVTVRDMQNNYFGWVQCHGPAAILTRGTIVVGNHVTRSTASVAGAVQAAGDDVSVVVGEVMVVNVTTDYSLIDLRL